MSFMDTLGSFTVGALEAMGTIIDATAQYKATEQLVNKLGNEALMNGAKKITITIDGVTKEFTSECTTVSSSVNNPNYGSRQINSRSGVNAYVLDLFDGACRHAGNDIGKFSWTAHILNNSIKISTMAGAHVDIVFVDNAGHQLDIRSYNRDQVACMLISHGNNSSSHSTTPASFNAMDRVDDINWSYYTPYGSKMDANRIDELVHAIMR